jgi:hypothetical protein
MMFTDTSILHSGILKKQSRGKGLINILLSTRPWAERFFIIKESGQMQYFDSGVYKGEFSIFDASIKRLTATEANGRDNAFLIHTVDDEDVVLSGESEDDSGEWIEIIEKVATRQIHILNRLKTLADVLDYESQKLTLAFDRKVLNEALSRDNLSRDSFSEIFEKQYLDSLTESVLRCRNQNSSFSSSFRSKCLSRVIRIQPNFDLPSSFRLTFTESGDFLMEFKHVTFRDNLDIDLLQVVLN